ncbi:hypothetical protein B5F10_13230 [Anaerotruncus colihominis]|uniref:Recombinase domain-containing protein n=1 Tax=Anaerotruncus colihominis TaxID=169435 RepID=A0A1Y4MYL6_9FIRM|nr:recombinase family protein [Anaerotruncus colihominis]OUP68457.1 hypothetical protein B5F11_13750 [Anaerotruncus colihominis]OUP72801.1 hypothetical protein B5F10_13230 [Anaerotruncus colihominis]
MAANRKLPFGYAMRMGKICIQEQEAGLVKEIFLDYIRGASFLQITEKLNSQPVAYNLQTRWNKNMVARILEDRRYVGEKGFPRIIDSELFNAALAKRAAKQIAFQPTELQKALRRLSGQKATQQMEQEVLTLLGRLIRQPECVRLPSPAQADLEEEKQLCGELDALMSRQPVEEETAKSTAYALAAARLNAIGSEDYETLRIKEVLTSEIPLHDLLKSIASAVLIRLDGSVGLRLKNGQTIERSKIS